MTKKQKPIASKKAAKPEKPRQGEKKKAVSELKKQDKRVAAKKRLTAPTLHDGAGKKRKATYKAAPAVEKKEPSLSAEKKKAPKHDRVGKLKVIPLGGLQEIGKNITLLEYGDDIIIIDCGMGFPDEDMPGVDLVIPDFSYVISNAHKVRGVLVTHGHEDHIGGIPYLLRSINVPIYGTRLSLGILEG